MGLSDDPKWYGERECVICGKRYVAHTSRQKTCGEECGKVLRKNIKRKWEKESKFPSFKKPEPDQPRHGKCQRKKKQFSVVEIAVLAKQEGMTYGQYVAKHNI